jgi:hypothetical protein
MKSIQFRLMLALACVLGASSFAMAQESHVSLALMPAQFITVKGDAAKFRAVNWINDGYQFGIKQLAVEGTMAKDIHVEIDTHAIPNMNENKDEVLISKDNVGYIKLNYDSFRKYYGTAAGVIPGAYTPVVALPTTAIRLDKDLDLDISNFKVELGNKTPNESTLAFYYERAVKNGDKNWLSWGVIKATSAASRDTAPTWQHLDETTDTVGIKNKFKFLGFTVKGDQKYTFHKGNTERPETNFDATSATASSSNKIRNQKDADQAKSLSAAYLADRWTVNDKTYFSMGYRFEHTRVTQNEMMREYDKNGNPKLYSNPKYWDAYARVTEDKNIITGHMHTNLTDDLVFSTKIKGELVQLNGISSTGFDCGPVTGSCGSTSGVTPDGVPNYYYNGTNNNTITSAAEKLSLNYSGISKTSIYSDLDFGQENNWKVLERYRALTGATNYGSNSSFARETRNYVPEWKGTVGTRITPFKGVNTVFEYAHKDKNDKLKRIDGFTITAANSYNLIYRLHTIEDALTTKLSWKPFRFLEGSFRAKSALNTYQTQFSSLDTIETNGTERDFVYGLSLTPTDELMFNLSYTIQQNKVSTPVSALTTSTLKDFLPVSSSNVNSWELGSSYAPTANLSFFSSLGYSRSKNGDANTNMTSTTSAYAYNNSETWYNAEIGSKLSLKKGWSVEPHYAFYSYRTKDSFTLGNYTANVMWLDITKKW